MTNIQGQWRLRHSKPEDTGRGECKKSRFAKPYIGIGASAVGDADAETATYADDAICDYPQSAERIRGRNNLQALRSHHPGTPSGFNVRRILGAGDLWITEYTIDYQGRSAYTVSIMEFRNGKVVHKTQYFADPFEAPAWRSQWVQHQAGDTVRSRDLSLRQSEEE